MIENFNNVDDFKLVKLKIKNIINISIESWEVQLYNKKLNKSLYVIVDIGQLTSILYGLSKAVNFALEPPIQKFINDLCKYNKMELKSVIINHREDPICYSKIEIEQNGNLIYFDISTGDAIALATINNIPIYTLPILLQDNLDNGEIEFLLES